MLYYVDFIQSGRKSTAFGIARNLQQIGSTLTLVFNELIQCIAVVKVYECHH